MIDQEALKLTDGQIIFIIEEMMVTLQYISQAMEIMGDRITTVEDMVIHND